MISAITNHGTMKWMVFEDSFTVPIFLQFLRRLIYKSANKIFLIVDNLTVHHAKKIKKWLQENKNKIEIFFLPPHCPEMNPQELVNQEVKSHASNFKLVTSMDELTINLRYYLTKIQFNPWKVMGYFRKSSVITPVIISQNYLSLYLGQNIQISPYSKCIHSDLQNCDKFTPE